MKKITKQKAEELLKLANNEIKEWKKFVEECKKRIKERKTK